MGIQTSQDSSLTRLQNILAEWGQLYNRKITQQQVDAWIRIFRNTDPTILGDALELVTRTSERMPTPGSLTKALQQIREKRFANAPPQDQFQFKKSHAQDHETGETVDVLIDSDGAAMFTAVDCPEGRQFLNMLHGV